MKIDTSKIKVSTKTVAGLLTLGGTLWQVPQVHDAVLKAVQAHPHWSGAVALIGTLWALLHDPQVKQILGLQSDAPEVKN